MNRLYKMGLLLMSLLIACEEIIEIDLEGTDPRIVIEGSISDRPGPYRVLLSRTTDYFDPSEYPAVTGATVVVSDDLGTRDTLVEVMDGIYETTTIQGMSGRTYQLDVEAEGQEYTASARLPQRIDINSIELEYYPETYYYEEAYWLHCHFTDPLDTANFYRVRVFKNDTLDKNIYGIDDKFIDGNPVDLFIWGDSYQPGDTAILELFSMDDMVYDYFLTLANLLYSGGDGSYSTPANPNTNLSNDALGYFGAFAIASDTIIVPDFPEEKRKNQ
jgi:hypothetical protein